jgi:hypothetical protein
MCDSHFGLQTDHFLTEILSKCKGGVHTFGAPHSKIKHFERELIFEKDVTVFVGHHTKEFGHKKREWKIVFIV